MPQFNLEFYTPFDKPTYAITQQIIRFLVKQSKQTEDDINKAVEYAIKERPSYGGFVVVLGHLSKIQGVAIINQTGLSGIMPDYILSHLETDHLSTQREEIKQKLIQKSLELSKGNIAMVSTAEGVNMPTLQCVPLVKSSSTTKPNNKSSEEFDKPRIRMVG